MINGYLMILIVCNDKTNKKLSVFKQIFAIDLDKNV